MQSFQEMSDYPFTR